MSDLQGVSWRYFVRLGLVAVLSALFFWLVLRIPFTPGDDSFGSGGTGPASRFASANTSRIHAAHA